MIPRVPDGESDRDHLFVYGTLRRGARMHALLAEAARPVGPATFRGRLYRIDSYPGAVASRDAADVVRGELFAFAVPEAEGLLARLDRYEGTEFRRVRAEVRCGRGDAVVSWIYLYRASLEGRARIDSGDFLAAEQEMSLE